MNQLESFMELLVGEFDNKEQEQEMKAKGIEYPLARHVNTICNQKINGLPEDFTGKFLVEESYYTTGDHTHASNHLFLFTEEEEGILLTSYEVPAGYDKNAFTYDAITTIQYEDLVRSDKFTPALYRPTKDGWEGGSVSMFSPVLKFTLHEKFTKEYLEVSESMEVNGKRTFGYDEPILYRRS